ncbi:hypothetical protein T484DRAFT_1860164 [Baffinella frigidus]|nr:hypothetical protein T484DRAFT_1860164 [Cryptophyta sp. CCMP2293]
MKNAVDPAFVVDESLDEAFICSVCANVVNEMTTGCDEGHGMCRVCYIKAIETSPKCPFCKEPTSRDKLQRNRPFDDLVAKLQMRCKHGRHIKGAGGSAAAAATAGSKRKKAELDKALHCPWVGAVSAFDTHLAVECLHEMVRCTNAKHGCHFESLRGDQGRHLADCVARAVKCKHCSAFFPKNKIAVHDNKCLEVPVRCPNAFKGCNVKNLTRGGSAGHVLVCGWAADKCTALGCGVVLLKKDMEKHMLESVEEHQQSLQCFVADLEKKVVALGRDNDFLRMKCLASKYTFEVQVLRTSGQEQPAKSALYKFGSGVTGVVHAYTEQYAEGPIVYVEFGITPTQREWRAHYKCVLESRSHTVFRQENGGG